jgi:hypothetical protein
VEPSIPAGRVLLTIQEAQPLTAGQMPLIEALAQPDVDFGFDPPLLKGRKGLYRSAIPEFEPRLITA